MDETTGGVELVAALTDEATAVSAVARMLDNAAGSADGLWDVESALRGVLCQAEDAGVAEDAPGLLLLSAALDAIAYRPSFDDGRCRLVPYLHFGDGTMEPPQAEAQPVDVTDRWRALRDATTHRGWRSRFGHLLVAADLLIGRERVDAAAAAVDDYLALPGDWGSGIDSVDALRAALSLTRQFDLNEQRKRVFDAILGKARTTLADNPQAPGIVLRLIHALVDSRDAPAEVDELLESARATYAGDVHNTDHVIEQQMARAAGDNVRRADLWRERVHAWLEAATAHGDARRAHFLQVAVEHANRSEDKALRDEATARLQELTLDDLRMYSISAEMVLRGEDIARSVRSVTDAPSWSDGLDAFATFGPPTGDGAENRRVVERESREFSKLFPVTQYGSDGLPRFSAITDEERAEYNLTQQETFNLQFQGRLVAEALLRFPYHHPLPTADELTDHFARSPIVERPLAAALARAFLRWWAGDYEGAGFTVAPRIEALARNFLLATNAPLYRLQREKAPGQYPGLGFLLKQLQHHGLPESWYRYLFTLLANPAGWNARNELAHGFLDHLDLVTSAMLLQCAATLALAVTPTQESDSDPPPASAPRDDQPSD